MQFQSLGQEDHMEHKMATHSSILAWRIPWTEEPSYLQSMGHKELYMIEATSHAQIFKPHVFHTNFIPLFLDPLVVGDNSKLKY